MRKIVKVILLTNSDRLISEIEEVGAEKTRVGEAVRFAQKRQKRVQT